jgi:hypothetical protein
VQSVLLALDIAIVGALAGAFANYLVLKSTGPTERNHPLTLTPQQKELLQRLTAYASIVMGVLTQALAGIHLPVAASAILGVFGILLHPDTSITLPSLPGTVTTTTTAPLPPAVAVAAPAAVPVAVPAVPVATVPHTLP